MYDIIGDVHGHAELLKKMLAELGYSRSGDGFSHPERKVIFVGDFVNRGDANRKTLKIVRNMVEKDKALAILGNHELYAILLSMKDNEKQKLVKIPKGNMITAIKTIEEFGKYPDEWRSYCKWMRKLPFFLDLGNLRVVHACWSDSAVNTIINGLPEDWKNKDIFINYVKKPEHPYSMAIRELTKGIYLNMPGDLKVMNNHGVYPRSFRLKWWQDPRGKTFDELSFESKFELPKYSVPSQILPEVEIYGADNPPVFFGHYSRKEGPFVISHNICCVDSWVYGNRTLTAYRWNGENTLSEENLVQVSM